MINTKLTSQIFKFCHRKHEQQECIPVECVLPASVAISPACTTTCHTHIPATIAPSSSMYTPFAMHSPSQSHHVHPLCHACTPLVHMTPPDASLPCMHLPAMHILYHTSPYHAYPLCQTQSPPHMPPAMHAPPCHVPPNPQPPPPCTPPATHGPAMSSPCHTHQKQND